MLQVTFRDLAPSPGLLAQASAGYAALRAQRDPSVAGTCFSVTLTHRGDGTPTPYSAVLELVDVRGARLTVATEAADVHVALRSALSASRQPGASSAIAVHQHAGRGY
jgi:hypothetical protein